jgi:hypothetical protein
MPQKNNNQEKGVNNNDIKKHKRKKLFIKTSKK